MIRQINDGANRRGVGDQTHANIGAINVQPADKLREKQLRQVKILFRDAGRLVNDENDVGRPTAVRRRIYNN